MIARQSYERRARRTLFWCAAGLCLSPLAGGWLVDHLPLQARDPEAAASIYGWARANPHPAILLLGSSRFGSWVRTMELNATAKGLLQGASPPIFNAALPAGEPITLQFVSRRLLESGVPPPRLVLLEISPELLPRNNRYFKFLITRQLTAVDLPKYLPDILLSHDAVSRLLSSRVTPFFLHRSQMLAWLGEIMPGERRKRNTSNILEANSFQTHRDLWEKDPLPLGQRMRNGAKGFEPRLRNYKVEGTTVAAFEATVASLRAHRCAVVLVMPPLTTIQRALFRPDVREAFQKFVQRLQSRYTCEFVDYSERLPDALFVDNHHASNAGSAQFTELLAKEVVVPHWQRLAATTAK